MFACCVREGVFPEVWKVGRLIVIPKGGDRPPTDPKAYRPITLLPVLGKVLERVMIECAPGLRNNISGAQHGFTEGRSTVTALSDIVQTAQSTSSPYVQLILLDISGAFDNAWWPMILIKSKREGCPSNIYKMLTAYFTQRRIGLFIGDQVEWKKATMGCPQGSVLGPTLWNVLLDDLLRLPMPEGVRLVAYADDVTVVIEAGSRAAIEKSAAEALRSISEWGLRNRLGFSTSKSKSILIKGKLKRPALIRLQGDTVKCVDQATILGIQLDTDRSFAPHASHIGERAAKCFCKMSRVSASNWGIKYKSLRIIYRGTYVPILTYAAAVWFRRASLYVVRSALLRSQRTPLILITKAYRSTSSAALPVLAGVLPADLELRFAGECGVGVPPGESGSEKRDRKRRRWLEITEEWQTRWSSSDDGRDLYRFFPDVAARLEATWVQPSHETSQLLVGHGCFNGRLRDLGLRETGLCYCSANVEEYRDHILWECELYVQERRAMLDNIERKEAGPVYFGDLVSTAANYRRFSEFARSWFARRQSLEEGRRREEE